MKIRDFSQENKKKTNPLVMWPTHSGLAETFLVLIETENAPRGLAFTLTIRFREVGKYRKRLSLQGGG